MSNLQESDYVRLHGNLSMDDPNARKMIIHVHTDASDGLRTAETQLRNAARLGVSALGLFDHDTMNGYAQSLELASELGIQLIPGEEITTREGIHIGALNIPMTIPYGLPATETIKMINSAGGKAMAMHVELDKSSVRWDFIRKSNSSHNSDDHIQLVEVVNGGSTKMTDLVKRRPWARAFFHKTGSNKRALKYYNQFGEELKVKPTGGPDAHYLGDLGDVIMVYPDHLDPLVAMVQGEVTIYEKKTQAVIAIGEFLVQREKAKELEQKRRAKML